MAYYSAAAAGIGYWICRPAFTAAPAALRYLGTAVFLTCEAGNFAVHWHLSQLPSVVDRSQRTPPTGPLFSLVTSPNYTFEVLAWVGYGLMAPSWAMLVFVVVGTGMMAMWALDKHRGYRTSDPHYAAARKAIFPFLL